MDTKPNPKPAAPAAPLTSAQYKLKYKHPFAHRLLVALGFFSLLIFASLMIGILGYHYFAGLGLVDSILNASMILAGMGPVATLTTNSSKLFASAYALFSGVVFISSTGILLSPIFHHVLHKFHMDEKDIK